MIRCFYIDTGDDAHLQHLYRMLSNLYGAEGWFDATDYDSYTSGPCKLDTIQAIQDDLKP